MPHGDISDFGALALIASGVQSIFYPHLHFEDIGPLKGFFASEHAAHPELNAMIRILGGFMLILGCMLFTVRWNIINGKLSGLACIGCGANIAHTVFKLDDEKFVLGPFYCYAGLLVLVGLHLMFNANPMIKSADAKKK